MKACRGRKGITGLWLVQSYHLTWILASHWSRVIIWCGYWPLIGQFELVVDLTADSTIVCKIPLSRVHFSFPDKYLSFVWVSGCFHINAWFIWFSAGKNCCEKYLDIFVKCYLKVDAESNKFVKLDWIVICVSLLAGGLGLNELFAR